MYYDWWDDFKFFFIPIVGFLALAAAILFADYHMSRIACREKWQGSGMPARFGFFEGCLIRVEEGKWIPAKNYREL